MNFVFCNQLFNYSRLFFIISLLALLFTCSYSLVLPENILQYLDKNHSDYKERLLPLNSVATLLKADESVVFSIGIFRHGSRAPRKTYINDSHPFNSTQFWPDGEAQLTKKGMYEMYLVGKMLRYRYGGLLSKSYNRSEIQVRSNPTERVYQSAACLLAGLYYPEEENWHPYIHWAPVPIWEQTHDLSEISNTDSSCPRYYGERLEAMKAVNAFTSQYSNMISRLGNYTGMNASKLTQLYRYWDVLYAKRRIGYPLPLWSEGIYPEPLKTLQTVVKASLTIATESMLRLLAGPILKQYASKLRAVVLGQADGKMYLESGHSTTLIGLLPALGVKELVSVDTGAILMIDLHRGRQSDYIQLIYFKEPNADPEQLFIHNCGFSCPLPVFLQKLDHLSPQDWTRECQKRKRTYPRIKSRINFNEQYKYNPV